MKILKKLAQKILQEEINEYNDEINFLQRIIRETLDEKAKIVCDFKNTINAHKSEIIKLKKQVGKRPHFKRKKHSKENKQ